LVARPSKLRLAGLPPRNNTKQKQLVWKAKGLFIKINPVTHEPEIRRQLAVFKEGLVDLISEEELAAKLAHSLRTKKPLRVKYGIDPSASDIHLGHTVPLFKLRALQELGHRVIFLIGDFTARIGDPSGRGETRKPLKKSEVKRNAESYIRQVFKILERKKTEVVRNADWLERFAPEDFLRLTTHVTVHRLIERDDFKKRFEEKRPISLIEFLYPLFQAYDSVHLRSDVELGGTDQKFNLLLGRELQRDHAQAPQVVMTVPILAGTDGVEKMSKSAGNAIPITL
jgi:tyrosyl-tRNA synthetase